VLFAAKSLELGVSRNLDSGRARVGLAPSIPATRPTNAPLQRLAAALYRTTSRPANAHPGLNGEARRGSILAMSTVRAAVFMPRPCAPRRALASPISRRTRERVGVRPAWLTQFRDGGERAALSIVVQGARQRPLSRVDPGPSCRRN
jgi:hypothetical protein